MPENDEAFEHRRSSVLYLIDGSESMALAGALGKALKAACKAIREAARAGASAYDAAVLVYNVDGPQQVKNVKTLLSLQEPKIDDLKSLIRTAENEEYRQSQLVPLSGSSGDRVISAFHIVSGVLNQMHVKSLRRVVIITNEDDPFAGDEKKAKVARNLALDITNSPAFINPIFVKTTASSSFDVSKFWGSLTYSPAIYSGNAGLHNASSGSIWKPIDVDMLDSSRESVVVSRSRGKFVALRGQLQIHNLHIGVKGYNVVQPKSRTPTGKHIAVVENPSANSVQHREILNSEPTTAVAASGTEVDLGKTGSQRAFRLSGSAKESDWSVPVSEEDFSKLHSFEEQNMAVLKVEGFIAADVASHQTPGFIAHSMLIVPSDDVVAQSFNAFSSLHRSMVRKSRAAVLTLHHPKASKAPPTHGIAHAIDNSGASRENEAHALQPSVSCGLYFVPLPFQDDIRRELMNPTMESSVDETLCLRIQELLRKFKMASGFDPRRFPHPKTAQFAEVLEHHALNLPLETVKLENGAETVVEQADPTRPRYVRINKGAGKTALEVRKLYLARDNPIKLDPVEPKKRKKQA